MTCNRQYAHLFPEPSFVRPGVRFLQLVERNIDTGNVRAFGSVLDVSRAPDAYRHARRQAHAANRGAYRLRLGDGRWLQVSERRTEGDGVVGIYTDMIRALSPEMLLWISLMREPAGARVRASPLALGPRQAEILRCVQAGLRNRTIASRLGLAEQTVKNHVSRLIRRLGARNRGHLIWLSQWGGDD